MSVESLLIFAVALAVAAGSPGPSIAALVARVLSRGISSVLPFLAAMWVGEAIWLTCAVFGLAALAETFHPVFVVLKYAGIAYLAYLAWRMWTAPVASAGDALPREDRPVRLFAAGIAVTLGNPKIMVFYLALLPAIVDLANVTMTGWLELVAVMVLVLAAVDIAWAVGAMQARRLLKSERAVRLANRFSASMMASAAAAMAVRS